MADLDTLNSIVENYKDLLIIQYRDKPKAAATIESLVNRALSDGIIFDVRDGFNLDTAIGVQLDILGKYIGLDRNLSASIISNDDAFGLTDSMDFASSDESFGFVDSADFSSSTGGFLSTDEIISTTQISDDAYRELLKFQIINNNSNGSLKGIDDNILVYFGTQIVASTDNDMTITYFVDSDIGQLASIAIEKKVLPKPMGVGVNVIISDPGQKYFGLTTYAQQGNVSDRVAGLATYADFNTKEGKSLIYDKIITQ